jgi:twitching motility protein PilT
MIIMEIRDYLEVAVQKNASDIFIGSGRYVSFKIDGIITAYSKEPLINEEVKKMVTSLYNLAERPMDNYIESGDDDFSVTIPNIARFRVSAYRQRNTMAAAIRVVQYGIPAYTEMGIPEEVMKIATEKNGLVLVTGSAGSGKSTTLACVLDAVNKTRNSHIITLEDPIEYLHRDNKSLFSQREIASDTESYLTALRACLRQAPDIILLGEMRDHETIEAAMTAAETGHLVLSTLHTSNAVKTLDRIIDVFPPGQQLQIRVQLAMSLRTVVSQRLLPATAGGLIPVFEIMHVNTAIRNLIRESKIHQIDNIIQTAASEGMISMDTSIFKYFKSGHISKETALVFADNVEMMLRHIEG